MAYHNSNLGSYTHSSSRDMNGYIPEAGDGPFDLDYDHGSESTHDDAGDLTKYGEWWAEERWPEIVEEAVATTEEAQATLDE